MTRILIVDDHAIVRAGVRQTLALCVDFEVVAEAADGWDALKSVRERPCELVLLDMSLPGPSGVELIRRIRQERSDLPILAFTMHSEVQLATKAMKAGASGYVTKGCDPETLIMAIKKIAAGGKYIEPSLAEEMFLGFSLSGDKQSHELLSQRETQIFLKLASGNTINEIALELSLSTKTVSSHKARLMQKLKVENNAQMIRYAMQHGLID